MDILDDMGVSKLSAKVFLKVNYSFNTWKKLFAFLFFSKGLGILFSAFHSVQRSNEQIDVFDACALPCELFF